MDEKVGQEEIDECEVRMQEKIKGLQGE